MRGGTARGAAPRLRQMHDYRELHMLVIARALAMLSVLAGCALPVPPNSSPCQVSPGSQECQIWMYSNAGM